MTNTADSPDVKPTRWVLIRRILFSLGMVCCLQFLVVGMVGVIRGYSVQSWIPQWVMLFGIVLLMPFFGKRIVATFLSAGLLILSSVIGMKQGDYEDRAAVLYDEGRFTEALAEYRKEIDTWYLRLKYNHRESVSMFRMAECHAQLEQFQKARETYEKTAAIFQGYYHERAQTELMELDAGLNEISEIEQRIANAPDDQEKAVLLFDLAIEYRNVSCAGKAIEQYGAIQELPIDERFKEQAQRFADELREGWRVDPDPTPPSREGGPNQ